ncbi:ion channel [Pseudomonas sp. MN1F]|uniref:ion channel n=1 Tax=Pseudomonas sp. MN1F TaxID=1366632 RepID=UPI00128F4EDC|nr:ion channel [Pseudomonas sp. MN1F]MQG95581.1 two pore domain potassium channel family protein [Pseudomonas sp. MN1F]
MENPKDKTASDADLAQMILGVGPCTNLLLLLIGLILVFPHLEEGLIARTLLGVMFSGVLLVGAFATPQTQRAFSLKLGLAVLGISLQWTALWTVNLTILKLAGITYAVSLIITIAGVLRYVLKRGQITADKLHGALAGYIMIALAWSFIYAVTELSKTSSFGPGLLDFTQPGTLFKLIYFSFTTLTTTGFGDVVPLTNNARSLVMVEEFTGVFYVGVLIARLAGLYPSPSVQ